MAEHADLAAYVMGWMDPAEEAEFRAHLEGCASCRGEEAGLRAAAGQLRALSGPPPASELEARVLAAVAAEPPRDELAVRRGRRRRVLAGLAVAAAVVLAFALGDAVGGRDDGGPVTVAGTQELDAQLSGRDGRAEALVTKVAFGRVVEVTSQTIPVIPKGSYYELWFVGPGDRPGKPNRIAAGTWHPDAAGATDVDFLVAADPAVYRTLEVTREPPDGNPGSSGDVVLRSS